MCLYWPSVTEPNNKHHVEERDNFVAPYHAVLHRTAHTPSVWALI